MGIDCRVENLGDHLVVVLSGDYNQAEIVRIGTEVMQQCYDLKTYQVTVDARRLTGRLSAIERFELARKLSTLYLGFIARAHKRLRIAHVVRPGFMEPSGAADLVAARGIKVHVTSSIEGALKWLGVKVRLSAKEKEDKATLYSNRKRQSDSPRDQHQ